MKENLKKLKTETRNRRSMELDTLDTLDIITLMNEEDRKVALAVKKKLPEIAKAVDLIVAQLDLGGRVVYFGAGTSGRLGVLDASECPPTFSTTTEFVGLMAGGDTALRSAVEGAEDSLTLAVEQLKAVKFSSKDVAVGIAASGRTPYCIGGLEYAKKLGAKTISVTCNPHSKMGEIADVAIDIEVGPEILTGSTRLKSGTASKMVLNMLSTASMVRLGKTYGNLMVDVNPTNLKLIDRATRIIMEATGAERPVAEKALHDSGLKAKLAIVMILKRCDAIDAAFLLEKANGRVREALK